MGGYGCNDTLTTNGNVFVLDANGGAASSLHVFSGPDGSTPDGRVVLTADRGLLLGATTTGGPGGGGVLFQIPLGPKPTASTGGPYTVAEGATVTLMATGKDPDGGQVTFAWDLDNDGEFDDSSSEVIDYVAGSDRDGPGTYPVAVRVTTQAGVFTDASSAVTVTNVAPIVDAGGGVVLEWGQPLGRGGAFTDPGAEDWTATVDYGDGSGLLGLVLSEKSFTLAHSYARAGWYTVTVTVTDDDGGVGTDTFVVTWTAGSVTSGPFDQIADLIEDGTLNSGQGTSLLTKLEQALSALEAGGERKAVTMLEAFIHEVSAYENAGTLEDATADSLIAAALAVIDSISG
jgi:hypothetical protein